MNYKTNVMNTMKNNIPTSKKTLHKTSRSLATALSLVGTSQLESGKRLSVQDMALIKDRRDHYQRIKMAQKGKSGGAIAAVGLEHKEGASLSAAKGDLHMTAMSDNQRLLSPVINIQYNKSHSEFR
jgi:hypothetical protein